MPKVKKGKKETQAQPSNDDAAAEGEVAGAGEAVGGGGTISVANAGPWSAVRPALRPATLGVLARLGFPQMTPVQAATLPHFLGNRDVLVEAVTGSGKTLAFVVPLIEKVARWCAALPRSAKRRRDSAASDDDDDGDGEWTGLKLPVLKLLAVIVSPTRELAAQIHGVLALFADALPPGLARQLLIGGKASRTPAEDRAALRKEGAHILVGTPGRINQVLETLPGLDTSELEVLALDEADRLLAMGHRETVTSILRRLPKQRRTGMFSATQTGEVLDLVRAGMRNAVRVQVRLEIAQPAAAAPRAEGDDGDGDDADQLRVAQAQSLAPGATTPASLRNYYVACPQGERVARLALFLKRRIADGHKVMVFFLTCAAVEYFGKVLPDLPELAGATVLSIHGKQDQRKRKANYDAYVTQRPAVLFATDVAARGLDVPDIDWIAQFDPPQDPASFVHRAGRAGRMGREGASVVFLAEEELPYVDYVRIKGIPIVSLADRDAGIDPEGTDVDATGAVIRDTIRTKIARDRDIYDRSHLAFVSHTRGYKEHRLEYIFALRSLRLGHLASSWGLIDLPSMPEIKLLAAKRAKEQKRLRRAGLISDEEDEGAGEGAAAQEAQREGGRRAAPKIDGFLPPSPPIDVRAIPYKDKTREKARQVRVERDAAARAAQREAAGENGDHGPRGGGRVIARASEAWSEQRERKDKRELRRLKKQRKRDWLRAQREGGANANGGAGGGGGGGADGDSDGDGDDNAAGDFDDDYAAMQREKKLRKRFREGKMSRKELQEALAENGGSDDSEEALFRATQ